ncbi:28S ribosomal protein S33, mitochondrial [Intoshia linei]|uniref:28S ribosomal protein S33, mitochondrial n=1 Tax=Intoshia linei TaxID=1819745 RepID=A0A177B4N8_9BILA|nr:28S ribosomal protein S33, mitochondrial [Intoshia linei]
MSKPTIYAQKMRQLSKQIFGELSDNIPSKSLIHVVAKFKNKPYYKDERFTPDFYPRHDLDRPLMTELRKMGLYHDARYDFNQLMTKMRLVRGKTKWAPKPYAKNLVEPEKATKKN